MSRPLAALVALAAIGVAALAAIAAHTRAAEPAGTVHVHSPIDYLTGFSDGQDLPPEFEGASYRIKECGQPPPEGGPEPCEMKDRQAGVALAVPGGALLGGDRGEWGGELVFKPVSGEARVVVDRNTHGIAKMPFGIVAFVGMGHGRPSGAILLVERKGESYEASELVDLDATPADVARLDSGDLLFRTAGLLPQHKGVVHSCHLLRANRSVQEVDCRLVRSDAPRPRLRMASAAEVARCTQAISEALWRFQDVEARSQREMDAFRESGAEEPRDPAFFFAQDEYRKARKRLYALDEMQHEQGCATHLGDQDWMSDP